ncbi:hypothetical protein JX265_013989 [Neoarthrinium moseri]|uniref:BTB domain-containing protein n=1 Tax=Neoarthrinium moseri TaxID=1658444 RepID=A0A9Q0AFG2_9PEZI|nr:hypothetical protein JX265_013989 [Neoarthrinium moseri]
MENQTYDIAPDGDVILTLDKPNAPFAVWTEDQGILDPFPLEKRRRKRRVNPKILPVSESTEPVLEALSRHEFLTAEPDPNAQLSVEINDNESPVPESVVNSTFAKLELAGEDSNPVPTLRLDTGSALKPEIRFRLSSAHLILASLHFEKMLTGSWQESTLRSDGQYHIRTEDWDAVALLILMHIIHGRTRGVPRAVDLEMLAKIAVLVDYYECHETVEIIVHVWLAELKWKMPQEYGRDLVLWRFVSWVFSEADLFEHLTEIALKTMTGTLSTISLPIPGMIVDAINNERQESIRRILMSLHTILGELRDGQPRCSFECSSILLGALTIGMQRNGFLHAEIDSSFPGLSVESTLKTALAMQSPRWRPAASSGLFASVPHVEHTCNLQSIIQLKLGNKSSLPVDGLKLNKFRGRNNALRWSETSAFYGRSTEELAVNNIPSTSGAREYEEVQDHPYAGRFQNVCAQTRFSDFSQEELRLGYYMKGNSE